MWFRCKGSRWVCSGVNVAVRRIRFRYKDSVGVDGCGSGIKVAIGCRSDIKVAVGRVWFRYKGSCWMPFRYKGSCWTGVVQV